mmetsp:Transcript_5526/g.19978  ORF Transcript_5526/g.19978 Transcript_5526/m.19978 type:complete len:259 (-) Transcript_5526:271-1047(-)
MTVDLDVEAAAVARRAAVARLAAVVLAGVPGRTLLHVQPVLDGSQRRREVLEDDADGGHGAFLEVVAVRARLERVAAVVLQRSDRDARVDLRRARLARATGLAAHRLEDGRPVHRVLSDFHGEKVVGRRVCECDGNGVRLRVGPRRRPRQLDAERRAPVLRKVGVDADPEPPPLGLVGLGEAPAERGRVLLAFGTVAQGPLERRLVPQPARPQDVCAERLGDAVRRRRVALEPDVRRPDRGLADRVLELDRRGPGERD